VVEVAGAAERQALETAADLELRWLHRDEPGTPTLEQAARALDLPPGDGYVWMAGEAGALRPIRRHLRDERGIHPDRLHVDGYWKRGVVNLDHHAEDGEDG